MIDYNIRIIIFLALLTSLIAWQYSKPKITMVDLKTRWFHNTFLFGIDTLVVKLLQPILLSLVAIQASSSPFLYLDWFTHYPSIAIILSILILDVAIYAQHRATHTIPLLWRLHKVHHSDEQVDVTTAIRFHPIEIALSLLYKSALIYLFSIPIEAVLLFDILLNSSAMFNHTNGRLSKTWDAIIRLFIVTPDMHRIHHSIIAKEANSNYGFFLSCWDKWFNTYNATPKDGEHNLKTGMPTFENDQTKKTLLSLLAMPFKKRTLKH